MVEVKLKTPWFRLRISILIFMADDVPLRFMLRVEGSNDLVLKHPSVRISSYAKSVSVVTDFLELPLEAICECYFLSATKNGHTL